MGRLVSRAVCARELGISRQALEKLIRDGKIAEQPNTKSKRPKTLIDLDRARRDYARNTDPGKRKAAQQATTQKQKTSQASAKRPYGQAGARKIEAGGLGSGLGNGLSGGIDYHQARTAKTAFQAKLAEIAVKEKSNAVIEREAVARAATAMGRKLRDRLMAIPARLAPYLPREVLPELEHEIRQITEELAHDAATFGQ